LRAEPQAVLDRLAEFSEYKIVGLRECGKRAAFRRDIADLDRLGGVDGRTEQRHRTGRGNPTGQAAQNVAAIVT